MHSAALVVAAAQPLCAGLMTGRDSLRAGLSTIIIGDTQNILQAGETALGELSTSRGYAAAIAGKWHLGASEESCPTRKGFDEYRVGVIEATDGILYRKGMQHADVPEAAIAGGGHQ